MKKINVIILILLLFLCSCSIEDDVKTEIEIETPTTSTHIRIVACSDFQGESGHLKSEENMLEILYCIEQDGIDEFDAFFCCGDYDYEYVDSMNGIESLKNCMSYYVKEENMIFVQGNHDELVPGEDGLSPSGNNDPSSEEYGVFVIHEDDYMWYNSDEAVIKNTAYNLQEYLNDKIDKGYTKPIFILSHLALNYSMRTFNDGDGQYAKYIFDVINEAGSKGLNIIYLFGHNHSNGWDDYLGGASIYLKKGDNILIANNSKENFNEYKLNFTYMNAGYVGYYRNVNSGANISLTMTVFDIYDGNVDVYRYGKDGKHDLKSMGISNSYKGEDAYEANLTIYPSPQKIILNNNINTGIIDIINKQKNK